MDSVLIDLGFVKIYWYSIIILLGVFVGGTLIIKEAKRYKIPEDYIINMIIYTLIFAIIGARLYYVIFNWSYYINNIIEIFEIWKGGLAIHGGIIGGLIFILIYTKKYRVNSLRMLDIISVGLIIGQAIGRWGNFFNKEAHGPVTTLEFLNKLYLPDFIIEGMNIHGVYYQPTFLYESLWCLIGFVILLIYRRRKYRKIGQTTGLYLIWYGIGRFFIEGLRTDSLMLLNFKIAQIVSIILVIIGLFLIIKQLRGSKFENQYNDLQNIDKIIF